MSECSIRPEEPGDHGWNRKRIRRWILVGSGLGAIAGYLQGVDLVGFGSLGGLSALYAAGFIVLVAVAGGILTGYIGNAWNWFNDRLKEQNPRTITIAGLIECKRRSLGGFDLFEPALFGDGDWTFNVNAAFRVLMPEFPGLAADEVADEIRTRAAPDSGQSRAYRSYQINDPDQTQILHTEISSHIGDFAVVGGAVGSVAGVIAALVLCAVLGLLTLGFGLLVCGALLVLGAYLGGKLGGLIGTGIGEIADELSDFDERGEVVEDGACMLMTGRWVTDIWHQWNEIHDVESAQIIECDVDSETVGRRLVAAVGIGRHPTGRDP